MSDVFRLQRKSGWSDQGSSNASVFGKRLCHFHLRSVIEPVFSYPMNEFYGIPGCLFSHGLIEHARIKANHRISEP